MGPKGLKIHDATVCYGTVYMGPWAPVLNDKVDIMCLINPNLRRKGSRFIHKLRDSNFRPFEAYVEKPTSSVYQIY